MKKVCIITVLLLIFTFLNINLVYGAEYKKEDYEIINAAGQSTFCFYIDSSNILYGAGSNASGLMGNGTASNDNYINPKKIMDNVKKVSAGKNKFAVCITLSGDIYAWGNNKFASLGIGTTYNSDNETNYVSIPTLVTINTSANPIGVETGYAHALILYDNGDVYSFGSNLTGQLGTNLEISGKSVNGIPTKLDSSYFNNEKIIEIATCEYTSFILTESGDVYSFGENDYGLLCINESDTKKTVNYPVKTTLENIKHISANSTTAMAISNDNKVYSWGNNNFKQLGNSDYEIEYAIDKIEIDKFYSLDGSLETVTPKEIICGGITNFILSDKGDVYSFGSGSNGQVGFDVNDKAYSSNSNIVLNNVSNPTKIEFYKALDVYEINNTDSIYKGKLAVDTTTKIEVNIETLVFSCGNRTFFKDTNGNMWGVGDNTSGLLCTGDVNESKVPVLTTLYRIENYDKEVETKNYLIKPLVTLIVVFVLGAAYLIKEEIKIKKIKEKQKFEKEKK